MNNTNKIEKISDYSIICSSIIFYKTFSGLKFTFYLNKRKN